MAVLERLLRDPDATVRETVATFLQYAKHKRSVPLLQNAMSDVDREVATAAVEALGSLATSAFGDKHAAAIARRAVKALGHGRHDRRRTIRLATITALAAAHQTEAAGQLTRYLRDVDSRLRLAAAEALLRRDDQRTRRAVRRLRQDPDPRVRRVAEDAHARYLG
jgi:HEAT repeat protein